jgi:glycosyltransferase involved in cell wall biosynthesis
MLTVMFATFNGAGTIPLMLEAFVRMKAPEGGWKLVAVDNASTDRTVEILTEYETRLPLEILSCEHRGKNKALNVGLSHCSGDLLILTDDDVLPDEDWLVSYRDLADKATEFDIFGGVIRPRWEVQPPAWLLDNIDVGGAYAITPETLGEGPVEPERIWGPNMAVRLGVIREGGHSFDERVGPMPGQYIMGSETEFTARLFRLGHKAYFSRQVCVEHIVPKAHIELRWLKGRAVRAGRSKWARNVSELDLMAPRLFGVPRYLYRKLLAAKIEKLAALLTMNRSRYAKAEWEMNLTKGMLIQAKLSSEFSR